MGLAAVTALWLCGAVAPDVPRVAVARVETRERVVALTFDACATGRQGNEFDRAVFDVLRAEQIPATVFVSGRWVEVHRDAARELAAAPHLELGNHSYSHPQLTKVRGQRLLEEIERTEALIAELGRRSVAFRPPAGVWDRRVLRVAKDRSLPTVLWDVVSGDAGGHLSARAMVSAVLRSVRPGSIVIFHINGRGPRTREALPEIIASLRARGYRFVPLSELLKLPDARLVPAPPLTEYTRRRPSRDGRAPSSG